MLEDCEAVLPLHTPSGNRPGVITQNMARDGKFHATLIYKLDMRPKQWRARCGWPFGKNQSEFKVRETLDSVATRDKCGKCFPIARPARERQASTSDDQRASSAGGGED